MRTRHYFSDAIYHITNNTHNRFPYFEEEIFCNIFLDNLVHFSRLKSFELISNKINPDHCHIILQPTSGFNISQIMQSLKRCTSDQINQIIYNLRDDNPYKNLEWTPALKLYKQQYNRKYNYKTNWEIINFKWQKSFDDVFMRSEAHLLKTINYVKYQSIHHELPNNNYLYLNPSLPKFVFYPQKNKKR